jgi:hypothetical protein
VRPGLLALSSSTSAYATTVRNSMTFMEKSYIRVMAGATDSTGRVIAVDWSAIRNLSSVGEQSPLHSQSR